jgi:hypothetical protein
MVLAAMIALAAPRAAAGQSSPPAAPSRFEAWAGLGVSLSGPSGSLTSSYSPPLLFDGDFTSSATQTIAFETGSAAGVEGGVNVFFTGHAGFQVLVGGGSADLSGSSTPYSYALAYTSRQPPGDQEVPVVVQNRTPWPDPTGSLSDFRTSINGLVRIGPAGRTWGDISGGLTFHRLSGTLQPLAYTSFRLGGHSALFVDDYRLRVALEPTVAVGFNVGGDLNVAVARHFALLAGYRYEGGSRAQLVVQPGSVLNPDEITLEQPLADIAHRLALPPAEASYSGSWMVVGAKLTY